MRSRSLRHGALAGVALAFGVAALPVQAAANAATEVVTEADVVRQVEGTAPVDDWVLYSRTTAPSSAAFRDGPGAPPLGTGSFEISTPASGSKSWLFHYGHVGTPLGELGEIGYSTYRAEPASGAAVIALNLEVDANGDAPGGYTVLVFEPYVNPTQGAVQTGVWQRWDGDAGRWWSSRAQHPSAPSIAACPQSSPCSWSSIVAAHPDARIAGGVGVNQGSGNPGVLSAADAFTIDGTTYDFELHGDADGDGVRDDLDNCAQVANPGQVDTDIDGTGDACDADADGDGTTDTAPPATADACKNGGHATFNNPSFKNQGQCVSYVNGSR